MSRFIDMTFDEIYENILWNDNTSESELEELSTSEDIRILRGVAYHKNTSVPILVKLFHKCDQFIDANLRDNDSTPQWLKQKIKLRYSR